MIRRTTESAAKRRSRLAEATVSTAGIDEIAARHVRLTKDGLEAVFAGGKGANADKPVRLHFLALFDDETSRAIAEGWVVWNADKTPNSRYVYAQHLKYGFVTWLRDVEKIIPGLRQIDEALLARFAEWIGTVGSDGYVANRKHRQSFMAGIEQPLRRLQLSDTWAGRLSPELKLLSDPFGAAGDERRSTGSTRPATKNVIGRASYESLWNEAATRVEEDFRRYDASLATLERLEESGIVPSSPGAAAATSIEAYAAWLLQAHPTTVIPSYSIASRVAAYKHAVPRAVHEAAERLIYPRLELLLPYIYLTTAFFALNAEVALGMSIDDYRLDEVPGGSRRLRIFPDKPRGDGRQRHAVAETEDRENPARFLPFLERRTRYLRRLAPRGATRNAFLYFDHGDRQVRSIEKTTVYFGVLMKEFGKSAQVVEPISLNKLRLTTLDVVHEITNGDIVAVRAMARHKTTSTTHLDYRTEAMRNRYEELQGEALAEWHRFWGSGGKVDVASRPPKLSRTAATPGYGCLDPKDSPIPGQEEGKLCQAYGQCPICPYAIVFHRSPHAYRCHLALLERLEEAELALDGRAYLARWAEVKIALVTDHLLRFDDATILAATDVAIPLMPSLD